MQEFIILILNILFLNYPIINYVRFDNNQKNSLKTIIFFSVFISTIIILLLILLWLNRSVEVNYKEKLVELLKQLENERDTLYLQDIKIEEHMNQIIFKTVFLLPYYASSLFSFYELIYGDIIGVGVLIKMAIGLVESYQYSMTVFDSIINYLKLIKVKAKIDEKKQENQRITRMVHEALFARKIYEILLKAQSFKKKTPFSFSFDIKNLISKTDLYFLSQFLFNYLCIITLFCIYYYVINKHIYKFKIELYICNYIK